MIQPKHFVEVYGVESSQRFEFFRLFPLATVLNVSQVEVMLALSDMSSPLAVSASQTMGVAGVILVLVGIQGYE